MLMMWSTKVCWRSKAMSLHSTNFPCMRGSQAYAWLGDSPFLLMTEFAAEKEPNICLQWWLSININYGKATMPESGVAIKWSNSCVVTLFHGTVAQGDRRWWTHFLCYRPAGTKNFPESGQEVWESKNWFFMVKFVIALLRPAEKQSFSERIRAVKGCVCWV